MCGRFSQEAELSEIKLELKVEQLELFREFRPAYNIAPSHGPGSEQAFVLQTHDGERTLRLGRWWLIPRFWNKALKQLPAAFNARSEELQARPFWRESFRAQRCLVPATGWREFRVEGGHKQPYHFKLDRRCFAFAGLWSRWVSPEAEVIDSFSVVTTAPNAQAAEYHDRMPLVMPPHLYSSWLSLRANADEILREARALSARLALEIFPSNPIGNHVRFEGPAVVERLIPGQARSATSRGARPARAKSKARASRSSNPGSVQASLFAESDVAQPSPPRGSRR